MGKGKKTKQHTPQPSKGSYPYLIGHVKKLEQALHNNEMLFWQIRSALSTLDYRLEVLGTQSFIQELLLCDDKKEVYNVEINMPVRAQLEYLQTYALAVDSICQAFAMLGIDLNEKEKERTGPENMGLEEENTKSAETNNQ